MAELNRPGARVLSPQQLIQEQINNIDTTAWVDTPRMAGDPNYFGRNLQQWRQHNRTLGETINNLAYAGEWDTLDKELRREGYKFDELEKQLNELEKAVRRGGTARVRQDIYDVSQAAADEEVSLGLLKAMGIENPKITNTNPLLGTDLSGEFKGSRYNIDAQQRFARDGRLNLSATQLTPGLLGEIQRQYDRPIIDVIDDYRESNPRGRIEGKLLQTEDTYWNGKDLRSKEFADNVDAFHKDALISNARPGENKKLLHDKVIPQGTAFVNLHKARELLLPMSYQQVRNNRDGVRLIERGGGELQFVVPQRMLVEQLSVPNIDSAAVNAALNKRIRRR